VSSLFMLAVERRLSTVIDLGRDKFFWRRRDVEKVEESRGNCGLMRGVDGLRRNSKTRKRQSGWETPKA
jgi:hypothetical protein